MTPVEMATRPQSTCTCGCCGGEESKPVATTVAMAEPKPEPEPRTGGCTCAEGTAGCACSGGADCTCGSEEVA
jgi:hypothetical protein